MRPVRLEEAGRDVDAQLRGERLHRAHRRMLGGRPGIGEQALILDPAEIFALEKFGGQDDLRTLRRRLADEARHVGDVAVDVGGEAKLQRGDGDFSHRVSRNDGICWLMQWKLPPPVKIWSARWPTTRRVGKSACMSVTAASSFGAP